MGFRGSRRWGATRSGRAQGARGLHGVESQRARAAAPLRAAAPVRTSHDLGPQHLAKFRNDCVTRPAERTLRAVDTGYRQEFKDLFDANFGRLEARMDAFESRVDAKLEALKAELLRWMFLFWVGTMGTVLAILKL